MGEGGLEILAAGPAREREVLELWARLAESYGKTADPKVMQESYRYTVAHPEQVQVFVAVAGGRVLGTVSLHLRHFSTWNNHWYGHVEDLFVVPEARRRGVAARLLQHVLAAARTEKLGRLELHTLKENRRARALYEKLGFECSSLLYDLSLKE
jgi:ribosomal protein S18 acetylase RimI-like enzyme